MSAIAMSVSEFIAAKCPPVTIVQSEIGFIAQRYKKLLSLDL